jgi:hypothetical protein
VTPERPPGRYRAAMLPEAHRRSALSGGAKLLLVILVVVLAVIGIPALATLGWQELGLVVVALLILTWPALAFYAWARRRGDL